jgi:hypothetical protein
MRVLELFHDGNIVELDVEILVDAFESSANLNIVLQLDGDLMINERLEEAMEWQISTIVRFRSTTGGSCDDDSPIPWWASMHSPEEEHDRKFARRPNKSKQAADGPEQCSVRILGQFT